MPDSLPETRPLRAASREVVRELGFLVPRFSAADVTHAQCHALLEVHQSGRLLAAELAERLRIDKSTASRTVADLVKKRLLRVAADSDQRRRPLELTAAGLKRVERIDQLASGQVDESLRTLTEAERSTVLSGMRLYAKALARGRRRREFTIRPIEKQDDPQMARVIRQVMTEHGASGAGFAIHDPEVDEMSVVYSRPRSAYFVVEHRGRVVGGGGIAPLSGGAKDTCELRKMYFLPQARALGLGAEMLARCLDAARGRRFKTCYLETLKSMGAARRLYESFGFHALARPSGATGHFGCDAWYSRVL